MFSCATPGGKGRGRGLECRRPLSVGSCLCMVCGGHAAHVVVGKVSSTSLPEASPGEKAVGSIQSCIYRRWKMSPRTLFVHLWCFPLALRLTGTAQHGM